MAELGTKSPISLPGPVEPHYVLESYLTFEGFGLDEKRKQHYLDATVAYVQASSRDIEYLRRLGNLSSFIHPELHLSCAYGQVLVTYAQIY